MWERQNASFPTFALMPTPPLHLLRTFLPVLPDEVWADFAPIWQPFEAKRKVLLTAEGQVERHLYFVLEGIGRIIVEIWRGDLDRGAWLGLNWLTTGRLTALGFIALGIGIWAFSRNRPPFPESKEA